MEKKLAKIFQIMADFYDSDIYRKEAYINASQILIHNKLPDALKIEHNGKRIGEKIRIKIEEFIKTGKIEEYEEIKKINKGNLTHVIGIGPEQRKKLMAAKIFSIEDLRKAYKSGKILLTKSQILGMDNYEDLRKKMTRVTAENLCIELMNIIKKSGVSIFKYIITGSYRRGKKTIGDLDIILMNVKYDPMLLNKVYMAITKSNNFVGHLVLGETKLIFLFKFHGVVRQIDLYNVDKHTLIPFLLYSTGSWQHNEYIRGLCKKAGYKLNQYGLYKNDKLITLKNEKSIYDILKIEYIEPINR